MVEILGFPCHGPGSIPGQKTEILQAGLAKKREEVQSQGHRRESTGWKPVTLRVGSHFCCCLAGISWASSFMFLLSAFYLLNDNIKGSPPRGGCIRINTCQVSGGKRRSISSNGCDFAYVCIVTKQRRKKDISI